MKDSENFSLRIKFGEVEFEASGREELVLAEKEDFLSRMKSQFSDTVAQINDNGQMFIASRPRAERISFIGLKKKYSLKNDTEMVLGAAYCLRHAHNKATFTSDDIRKIIRRAKVSTPKNVSQAITQNIKKGLIEELEPTEKGLKTYQTLPEVEAWLEKRLNEDDDIAG